MRCVFWHMDCPYYEERIEIPDDIRSLFRIHGRGQMAGDRYYHIPFDLCEKCLKHHADDYGRNTEDYGVLLNKSRIFPGWKRKAEYKLKRFSVEEIKQRMKESKEKARELRRKLAEENRVLKWGELALKRWLEEEK